MTYRENARPDDAPRGWVDLVWRWLMLRRQDRFDREAKALEAPRKMRATYMQRRHDLDEYEAKTVVVSSCPGKTVTMPVDPNGKNTVLYYLCTAGNCCCEVIQ